MKIREMFVSNSSSSNFIVMGFKSNNYDKDLEQLKLAYSHQPLVVDGDFGETEFGWGPDDIYGFGSKVIFSYLQCLYDGDPELLKMLESVLIDKLNVSSIEWKVGLDYDVENITHGYIDHQSSASEGENLEMFDSEEKLCDFLFNNNSHIVLDNDNH